MTISCTFFTVTSNTYQTIISNWLFVCVCDWTSNEPCLVFSGSQTRGMPPTKIESLPKFVDMTNGCILCKQWFLARNTIWKCSIEIEVNTSMQFDGKICICLLICTKSFCFASETLIKWYEKKSGSFIGWDRKRLVYSQIGWRQCFFPAIFCRLNCLVGRSGQCAQWHYESWFRKMTMPLFGNKLKMKKECLRSNNKWLRFDEV